MILVFDRVQMSLGVDAFVRATPFSSFSGWGVSDWDFFNLKCSCGSCRWRLPHGGVEIQKPLKMKKVVPLQHFQKTFFHHHFQKWKKWKRSLRARETKNYQPKVKLTYMYCVYVCWRRMNDTEKSFMKFFHHKINHVALLFLRTDFLKHHAVTTTLLRPIWGRFQRPS